ncbi:MAG TPA: ABC transporter ATP-binding protein, partial [Enterobacteriaceae bacterium]|nr:ABC transporter ATP-binding protein [Enterobacteriaceae bacterium]
MSLISMHGAWLSFSDAPLLDNAELHIEDNERVCLVGRNGAGKSTLMKILNREQGLDDGRIVYEQDLVIARLQQDPPRNVAGSVYDFVAGGIEEQAEYLKQYHEISHLVMTDPSDKNLNEMARLQELLDHHNLWQIETRINDVLSQLGLDPDTALAALSGGWLRKAALGRALVSGPRVLLLDEPTNHLDIETIDWLEGFLKSFGGTIIFISHDRSFIRNMSTRIVDLDRGKLVSYPGNYDQYLLDKEEALRVEDLQNAEFDRKLAQEEVWIRQGIKARRTRNEGRVRALKAMRNERSERREVMGSAKMQVEEASRSGKIVFEMEGVDYHIADKPLVRGMNAQVQRGDKIALIGPNGCGKTTLLKLMLGQLEADSGRVHVGTKLEVAYFDQHRAELDPDRTVMDNLSEGKQEVMVNGKPRHVLGYLQDFLFHPKRAMTPVRALSGGERNRLLLARLFLKPSNLLILDEPTNDLDVETLELLEELIDSYQGTVLLVSHDRQFVDNTVTECWIFEGEGRIGQYVGGYHDARGQQAQSLAHKQTVSRKSAQEPAAKAETVKRGG